MHCISTPLLILVTILFSTTAMSQNVTLSHTDLTPTPEANELHGPVLAKDNFGNLYQAATVHQGTFQGDFILAKYNGSGSAQWSVFWSSTGFEDDEVAAITTDLQGNIIITGTTAVPAALGGPYTQAVVVKYNPAGTLLWAVQSRLGKTRTAPTCVTTDNADNILVGGAIANSTTDPGDFLVVKFDSTGAQQWTATYNGTAGQYDQVTAIATDSKENVYITGESMGQIKFFMGTIPEGFDYETIKYSSGGQTLWSNRYSTTGADIPSAMTLDAAGNVYVTGSSNNSGTTLCYSTAGTQQWALRSDTAQNYTSIGLDPSGNVVTAGYYITSSGLNYRLTKSTATGSLTWSVNAGAGAGPYVPLNYGPYLALAIDQDGYIYIAGEAITSGTGSKQNLNFWTLKYSLSGVNEWSRIYNGYDSIGDVPSSIAIINPPSSNPFLLPTVFVGGFSNMGANGGNSDAFTLLTYTQSPRLLISSASADTVPGGVKALDNNTLTANLSNYPNPFRGMTNVTYTLPNDSHVFLQVFDITGNTIATLVNEDQMAGPHTVPYNPGGLAAGIYEYRIVATSSLGNFTSTKKMIVR